MIAIIIFKINDCIDFVLKHIIDDEQKENKLKI